MIELTDSPYAGKTFAEVVDDYVLVRGDLVEEYARKQLVAEHEARVVAALAFTGAFTDALADHLERTISRVVEDLRAFAPAEVSE